jgi:hypothetical protein
VTAEIKYKRLKSNKIHAHIYYHCNRIKKYNCPEPYITEAELIKQLITYLPKLKLKTKFLIEQFNNEIVKLQHLKHTVLEGASAKIELTPHNKIISAVNYHSEEKSTMLRDYLLHILQFGTPEERIKILAGVTSKFKLTERQLQLI